MKVVNAAEFDNAISSGYVLVDFFAEWCGPCKMMHPVLEELDEAYLGKVAIVKVDVDAQPAVAQRFEVRNIPSIFLFKDGKVIDNVLGFNATPKMKEFIDKHLG